MTPRSPATLRQIAELTGLSRMAVSVALRGKPGVSDSTRRKVEFVAAELGFVPDPEVSKFLSRIRTKQSGNGPRACLALLTSGACLGAWRQFATERRYVEGAEQRALAYGYRLEEFWMDDPALSPSRFSSILWSRGIEGVVVAPVQGRLSEKSRCLNGFDFARFSCVEISETVETPDLDRAIHDQFTSMRRCLSELDTLGYQRVGLVLERALDLRANGRWTAALLERRLRTSLPPPLILEEANAVRFSRWFERHQPDAIVSVDGFALRLMKEAGIRTPRDVAYASLDLDGEEGRGAFAGIDQNSSLVGAAAIDVLVASIQRGSCGIPEKPIRMEIEGTWIGGPSAPNIKSGGLRKPKAALSPTAR